jgi:hypothetical protein
MEASRSALDLPAPGVHIPYTVVSVLPREELLPDNHFVEYREVTFEGPSHSHDSVKIPLRDFAPAAVDRAIQDRLHDLESVHALGVAPHPENLPAALGGPPES